MRRFICLLVPALFTLAWCSVSRADDDKGTLVTLDKLKSTTPATWKSTKAGNKFRVFQFSVPKATDDKTDGEVVVFFFGEGSGGSVEDNLKRWKKMFKAPDGKTVDEVAKQETFKVGKVNVNYLDITGTYLVKNPPFDPKAKTEEFPNYRVLNVYFDCDNGPYFLRMSGPAKTVEKSKKGFDDWVKNFK